MDARSSQHSETRSAVAATLPVRSKDHLQSSAQLQEATTEQVGTCLFGWCRLCSMPSLVAAVVQRPKEREALDDLEGATAPQGAVISGGQENFLTWAVAKLRAVRIVVDVRSCACGAAAGPGGKLLRQGDAHAKSAKSAVFYSIL